MKPNTIKENQLKLVTENGEPFEIPEGGSLGLLALGYVGLMLWREKRKELKSQNQMNEKT